MKKSLIAFIASLAMIATLGAGSAAQAAALTATQISAIVSLLQSFGADATTVANVTASLNGQPTTGATTATTVTTSGYNFAKDLTVGSRGADVTALQNLLGVTPATGYFGSLTKAAVINISCQKESHQQQDTSVQKQEL
jgi:peptidoglycan hydrolase-like protein with peptidoglycan-binding domain